MSPLHDQLSKSLASAPSANSSAKLVSVLMPSKEELFRLMNRSRLRHCVVEASSRVENKRCIIRVFASDVMGRKKDSMLAVKS